jgi:hypothetical protein
MSKWTVVGWPIYMFDVIRDGRNTLVGDGKIDEPFPQRPLQFCVL